ncbi:MAG: YncE family protein [Pseudonocardiaceae bacterium]|nr:MAG: YncE family protein [Pseudonocardiaceae bacterium]
MTRRPSSTCVVWLAVVLAVLSAAACTGAPSGDRSFDVHSPGDLALSPDGGTAYVVDQADGVVRAVDTGNGRERLPVDAPFTDSLTADHAGTRLFAFSRSAGAVTEIDLRSMTVVARISADDPVAVAIAPDDSRAYVASGRGGSLTVLNLASGAAVVRPVGVSPSDVVAAGGHVYVALAANRTVAVLTPDGVAVGEVRLPASAVTRGNPIRIAVTPDGSTLLALDPVRSELYVVDPRSSELLATLSAAEGSSELRMSADGARAYVVGTTTTDIAEIDVQGRARATTVSLGCTPGGIAETPDGRALVATCPGQDMIAIRNR